MTLYLNALGIVTPLGQGKGQVAANLFAGSRDGMVMRDGLLPDRAVRVGAVPGELPEIPAALDDLACRNNRLALACLAEIEHAVAQAVRRHGADRIGVVMGTSTSGLAEGEVALAAHIETGAWPQGYSYSRQELGNTAMFVARACGARGPAYTISTACSSSGKVFASAARLIDTDLCDAVLVGGADSLCRLTVNGFASLEAISKDYCNPFSRNRDGINIGEGAAVFLMSRTAGAVALRGIGESSDAYHVSAPDPAGTGAMQAMRLALAQAGLAPDEIGYVNLHGTATRLNDVMEGLAVASVFGSDVTCSSTKALTGHMLGAAGACEAAFLWLALTRADGGLPPHIWDGEADAEIPLRRFVESTTRLSCNAMLSNSFAFGGSNVAVVLARGAAL